MSVVKPKPKQLLWPITTGTKHKMNQSEIKSSKQAIGAKCGKTRASKSRLVLVLRLIGWESGASFFNQSESEVKQNQSKHNITFDIQLKTALASTEWSHLTNSSTGSKHKTTFIHDFLLSLSLSMTTTKDSRVISSFILRQKKISPQKISPSSQKFLLFNSVTKHHNLTAKLIVTVTAHRNANTLNLNDQ